MAEKNIFYVNLNSPIEIQRSLLESTKHILSNLKRYEDFRKIRELKIQKLLELQHIMGELRLMNNRLKRVLPTTGLRATNIQKEPEKKTVKVAKAPKKPKPPMNNLEKLEDELKDIESKIQGLK